MKKNKNYGFTLIEMIAVMAIIAIISSIAMPKISRYIDSANKTKVIAAVSELNNFLILEKNNETDYQLSTILNSFSNLESLKINLNSDGNFSIGNVKGHLELKDDYINAILESPKEFSNQIIGPSSK